MKRIATLLGCSCLFLVAAGMALQDPGEQPVNPDGTVGQWYSVCTFTECDGVLYDHGAGHPLGCVRKWSYWSWDWYCEPGAKCTECRNGFKLHRCESTQTNPGTACSASAGFADCGQEFRPPCFKAGDYCRCMDHNDPNYPPPTGEDCSIGQCQ